MQTVSMKRRQGVFFVAIEATFMLCNCGAVAARHLEKLIGLLKVWFGGLGREVEPPAIDSACACKKHVITLNSISFW